VRRFRGASAGGGAGFTLLELVLAMSALALLSAICYGAFHVGIRAVEKGEVAVVTAQRLRVVMDMMIRQVKSAVATVPAGRTEGEEDEDPEFITPCPYFVGSRDFLSFLTAAGMLGGGGLSLVTYRVLPDPPRLVVEETPWPAELPGREWSGGSRATVALEGFTEAWFEYHPPVSVGDPPLTGDWLSAWDACSEDMDLDVEYEFSLPGAVRFRVRGLPGVEVDVWTQEIPTMLASASPENASGGEGF
jgi:prepilin-type N-terminal cleavage/methylation domain-containing protein